MTPMSQQLHELDDLKAEYLRVTGASSHLIIPLHLSIYLTFFLSSVYLCLFLHLTFCSCTCALLLHQDPPMSCRRKPAAVAASSATGGRGGPKPTPRHRCGPPRHFPGTSGRDLRDRTPRTLRAMWTIRKARPRRAHCTGICRQGDQENQLAACSSISMLIFMFCICLFVLFCVHFV